MLCASALPEMVTNMCWVLSKMHQLIWGSAGNRYCITMQCCSSNIEHAWLLMPADRCLCHSPPVADHMAAHARSRR